MVGMVENEQGYEDFTDTSVQPISIVYFASRGCLC